MARISPRSLSNRTWLAAAALLLAFSAGFVALEYSGAEPPASAPISVPVRFTDVRAGRRHHFPARPYLHSGKELHRDHGQRPGLDRLRPGRIDGPVPRADGRDRVVQAAAPLALRPLSQQWRRHLHGRDGKGRSGRRGPLRAGRGGGRLRQRSAIPTSTSPAMAAPFSTTTTAMALSRM